MHKKNSFSKKYRLVNKQAYAQVFRQGKITKSKNRLFKVFYLENSLGYPRLGLALAKKNNPRAVQRNRIKRQLRETFRRCRSKIYHHDMVVMSINAKNYSKQEISASFIECLNLINDEEIISLDD